MDNDEEINRVANIISRRGFLKTAGAASLGAPLILGSSYGMDLVYRGGNEVVPSSLEAVRNRNSASWLRKAVPADYRASQTGKYTSEGYSTSRMTDYQGTANPAGVTFEQLTSKPYSDDNLDISPDGKQLIFESNGADTRRWPDWILYTMNLDDRIPQKLEIEILDPIKHYLRPKYSPDGKRIAFKGWDEQFYTYLYITDVTGKNTRRIFGKQSNDIERLSWHPSGDSIFYELFDGQSDIYRVSLDNNRPEKVYGTSGWYEGYPAVSPDGNRLAIAIWTTVGISNIYVLDLIGGGKPEQITFGEGPDAYPSWSHDGKRIAFSRGRTYNETPLDIYMVDLDTLEETKLTDKIRNGEQCTNYCPVWSPDDNTIYFLSVFPDLFVPEDKYYHTNIWMMENVLTGVEKKVTMNPEGFSLAPNYPNPFNSGTYIEYTLGHRSDVQLSIYNIKGELVETIVNEVQEHGLHKVRWPGTDMYGVLTPTGTYIYKLQAGNFNKTGIMQKVR